MIKVREATMEDLALIVALMKRNNEPLNEDLAVFFTAKNPNEEYKLFVAEENDRIIGFSRVHFYRWNKSAYAINLLVDSEYRRRGIGTLLLKTMERFAKEKGARVLMFDTAIDNIPALNLCFKNGFKICGYNNKLYEDKKALYLAKEL